MRTTLLRFLPLLALFATGCVIEVEDDDDDWSGDGGWAGRGGGGKAGGPTAGTGGAAGAGGAAGQGGAGGGEVPPAFVRFAHLAPTTGPVDVCLRPVDYADTWTHPEFVFGPIFADNATDYAQSPDADPKLVPNPRDFYFPGVSTYFELSPPGAWQVRLVPASDGVTTRSCDEQVDGVVDLSLDLSSGQVLTVALTGAPPVDAATPAPLALGWAPYGGPTADEALARGHVINALSGGAEVTLGAFDAALGQVVPLASAPSATAGAEAVSDLNVGAPTRYAFLGAPNDDGTRPLLTPLSSLELTAEAGDVWTFFAAGTAAGETEPLLQPQMIACRNATDGLGVNDASLIAADCTYLNSKTAAPPPAQEPTPKTP